jgi:hypothetical protein
MKDVKCENCGKVIIKLAKGSQIKPNIYAMHDDCPSIKRQPLTAEEIKTVDNLKNMFGMK